MGPPSGQVFGLGTFVVGAYLVLARREQLAVVISLSAGSLTSAAPRRTRRRWCSPVRRGQLREYHHRRPVNVPARRPSNPFLHDLLPLGIAATRLPGVARRATVAWWTVRRVKQFPRTDPAGPRW